MTAVRGSELERRVLAMAPTRRDAATTLALLSKAQIPAVICDSDSLMAEVGGGAAAILIPEEAVGDGLGVKLAELLERQPPWSDLPVLVLVRPGANSAASGEAVRTLGNVTLIERPVQVATLLSAVRAALRARQHQYQIRSHLAERARTEESLRVADQRKDEFLATLGHELRNPLAPLMTGLQLLKTAETKDLRLAQVTAIMDRQLHHLIRLVDDLLEMSRISRGLVKIQRDVIDLVPVLHTAVDTSRPIIDKAGHLLQVDLPDEPLAVSGDAVRLTQVFANLLTNAAKYTNSGGTIRLRASREDTRVRVSVHDNGIGIPESHLGTVFDMFMQVDRSTRLSQGGLGIGLTLVKSLVALHGGRVEARSGGPGTGSEFIVELPLVAQPVTASGDEGALAPLPSRRVLIVDDNQDAAATLAALLASLGLTVSVAHSGADALARLPLFKPDAAVLDIGMPEIDGYALARRIRADARMRGVLLIALTGWGQDHDVKSAYEAGFDHHLVKPPDLDKLRKWLGEAVVTPTGATPEIRE